MSIRGKLLDIKELYNQSSGRRAEGFSAWWWLGAPIVTAVVLSFLGRTEPDLYDAWIHGEKGLLEMSQAAIMVVATILGLALLVLPVVRQRLALFSWVLLATVCSFYVAGEELSWGQHLLNWSTPEYWGTINDQNETNLHNVSSWLDQKPRALLEIGVVSGGIVLPLAALIYPSIRASGSGIIIPPFLCLPSAVLAESIRLFERVADWFGGAAEALFVRPAEYQEFYFYLFVLFYLIVLGQRLRAMQAHMASLSKSTQRHGKRETGGRGDRFNGDGG